MSECSTPEHGAHLSVCEQSLSEVTSNPHAFHHRVLTPNVHLKPRASTPPLPNLKLLATFHGEPICELGNIVLGDVQAKLVDFGRTANPCTTYSRTVTANSVYAILAYKVPNSHSWHYDGLMHTTCVFERREPSPSL